MSRDYILNKARLAGSLSRQWCSSFLGVFASALVLLLATTGALFTATAGLFIGLLAALCVSALARLIFPPQSTATLVGKLREIDAAGYPMAAFIILSAALGTHSELVFPMIVLFLVWVSAARSHLTLGVAAGMALLGEIAAFSYAQTLTAFPALVLHLTFLSVAIMGGRILLRHEVMSTRRRITDALARQQADAEASAESLGLNSGDVENPVDITKQIDAIINSFQSILHMARSAVDAHSVVLMVRQPGGEYKLYHAVTPDERWLNRNTVTSDEGIFAVMERRCNEEAENQVLRISPLEGRSRNLPYYTTTPEAIGSLMAVPVMIQSELTGILFFDREDTNGFSASALEEAVCTAGILGRTIETQRALRTSGNRSELLGHLVEASHSLTAAFGPEQVYESVLKAATQFVPTRFAALVLCKDATGEPTIADAYGDGAQGVVGTVLERDGNLAALAIKNTGICPPNHVWTSGHGSLLGDGVGPQVADGEPVAAIPLIVRNRAVGALVMVAQASIDDEAITLFKLLASQAAFSVEHAQALAELRTRATTDGLTSLDNRQTIENKLNQSLARCDRSGQQLSVLMLDVDHFKQVNDTRGHQTGDLVLRQVAKTLDEAKRINDSSGRFGGEEFLLVLEDTGDAGARLVADRIRERISALQFPSASGPFTTTVSIGFSVFPRDGSNAEALVKRADQALYQAKNSGRDRTRGFRDNAGSTIEPIRQTAH